LAAWYPRLANTPFATSRICARRSGPGRYVRRFRRAPVGFRTDMSVLLTRTDTSVNSCARAIVRGSGRAGYNGRDLPQEPRGPGNSEPPNRSVWTDAKGWGG